MENDIKTVQKVMEYIAIRVQNGEWKFIPESNIWKGRYENELTSKELYEILKKELNIWDYSFSTDDIA